VQPNVGMTGEITLRGQVLPVGGIKEKVLAAHRFGLTTVILPRRNEADLEDLPAEVLQAIKFILVETVDEVINAALEPLASSDRKPRRKNKAPASASPQG
jgi:ATP-dependent Lon protease